jgi:hypothetical protein
MQITFFEADAYRVTTALLKARRGSEQYQSMSSRMHDRKIAANSERSDYSGLRISTIRDQAASRQFSDCVYICSGPFQQFAPPSGPSPTFALLTSVR